MISLTLKEFALAVGAEPKWVLNAAARLGRPFAYTDADAKWLRLARVLNRDLRLPLPHAATLAQRAVSPPSSAAMPESEAVDGATTVVPSTARPRRTMKASYGASRKTLVREAGRDTRATGNGRSSETAKKPGREPALEPSSEPAMKAAIEAANEPDWVSARLPARETRTDTARETRTDSAKETRTDTARETRTDRARETRTDSARETRTDTARETHTDTAAETHRETASETHRETTPGTVTVVANRGEGVRLVVDLARYESTFEAALAAAKAFGVPRRAGRKRRPPAQYQAALRRAKRIGIDLVALRATMRYPLETRLGGRSRWELQEAQRALPGRPDWSPQLTEPLSGSAPARVAELLGRLSRERVRGVVVGELAEVIRGAPMVRPEPCVEICYEPSAQNIRRIVRVLRDVDARPAAAAPTGAPLPLDAAARPAGAPLPLDAAARPAAAPLPLDAAARPAAAPLPFDAGAGPNALPVARVPGAATFDAVPTLVLATRVGALTVRPDVAGIGNFGDVAGAGGIMEVFDVAIPVLDVSALRQARHAAGTAEDMARVPYLDAVAATPLLEARRREVAALRGGRDVRSWRSATGVP